MQLNKDQIEAVCDWLINQKQFHRAELFREDFSNKSPIEKKIKKISREVKPLYAILYKTDSYMEIHKDLEEEWNDVLTDIINT